MALDYEYEMKIQLKREVAEQVAEQVAERERDLIIGNLRKGISVETIAGFMNMPISEIQAIKQNAAI